MVSAKPAIIELDIDKLEQILRRLDAKELDAEDYETIKAVLGSYVYLFFEELIRQAARGDVVHNDDTGVKILEVMVREHDKRLWPRRLSTPQGQMRIKAAAKVPPRVCRRSPKRSARARSPRGSWRSGKAGGSRYSLADASMRERTSRTCWRSVRQDCRRRSRCATP